MTISTLIDKINKAPWKRWYKVALFMRTDTEPSPGSQTSESLPGSQSQPPEQFHDSTDRTLVGMLLFLITNSLREYPRVRNDNILKLINMEENDPK